MTLIATVCVGDTLVTLTRVLPLTRDDDLIQSYNLTFTDLPTDKRYTKSIIGENLALQTFAAWIMADAPEENLKAGLGTLMSDVNLVKGNFLP